MSTSTITRALLATATGLAALFVATHLGAYPQIMETWWFTALALFVMANTLGFAVAAAAKMGFQSGRRALLRHEH